MTLQEKLVTAYDLAEVGGVKAKLKDLKGNSFVKYVIAECRKGGYTKEDVILDLLQSIKDITEDVKNDALEMYNEIQGV